MDPLAVGIRKGNRRDLARAITLAESTRPEHRERAIAIIESLRPFGRSTIRVGISGTPGVGKSTFIEAIGSTVIESGRRLAVLAIDPSSTTTRGAILGDKTRMAGLSQEPDAFIRPSPASGMLGGVSPRTSDAISLCEAAGFDVIFVETVGIGQSETLVAEMTDLFVLLVAPGGGDDLQGIKRGVMETTDIVVVNKADGIWRAQAEQTALDYRSALHLVRPKRTDVETVVMTSTSEDSSAVEAVWEAIQTFHGRLDDLGHLETTRVRQRVCAMRRELERLSLETLASDRTLADVQQRLESDVIAGDVGSSRAALEYIDVLHSRLVNPGEQP